MSRPSSKHNKYYQINDKRINKKEKYQADYLRQVDECYRDYLKKLSTLESSSQDSSSSEYGKNQRYKYHSHDSPESELNHYLKEMKKLKNVTHNKSNSKRNSKKKS